VAPAAVHLLKEYPERLCQVLLALRTWNILPDDLELARLAGTAPPSFLGLTHANYGPWRGQIDQVGLRDMLPYLMNLASFREFCEAIDVQWPLFLQKRTEWLLQEARYGPRGGESYRKHSRRFLYDPA
jgi:hypothetical protein